MSKIGVGVGEDFPVAEDVNETSENNQENCRHGRHGRERWGHFRHKMRELRAARHAFHHHHGDAEDMMAHIRAHHLKGLLIGGLALIGAAAILSALHSRR